MRNQAEIRNTCHSMLHPRRWTHDALPDLRAYYAHEMSHKRPVSLRFQKLLNHGTDVDGTNIYSCTPLHSAVSGDKGKDTAVRLLIDKGANVDARDVDGHLVW